MEDGTESVKLSCSCGSDKFSSEGERDRDTVMTCVGCGATGKYGDLIDQAAQQIKDLYSNALGNLFRK